MFFDEDVLCKVYKGGKLAGIVCTDCMSKRPLLRRQYLNKAYLGKLIREGILPEIEE